MITAGIDIGSISAKAVILEERNILGTVVIPTSYNAEKAGVGVFNKVLSKIGISSSMIEKIVATGYGRNSVSLAHKTVTEISCHAMGGLF